MLKISKWQASPTQSPRYYLNGFHGIPKNTKGWVENVKGVLRLKSNPPDSLSIDLNQVLNSLLKSGLISETEFNQPNIGIFERLSTEQPTTSRPDQPKRSGTSHSPVPGLIAVLPIELENPVTIQIDHREPAEIFDAFSAIKGVVIEKKVLTTGDFVFQGGIVERKTAADFSQSIIDKRLFFQSDNIGAMDAQVLRAVIMEGDIYSVGRLNPNALDGAISYLAVLQGISVLHSSSPQHTANLVSRMASHSIHGLGYEISYRPAKPKSPEDQILYILQGIPGIGVEAGKSLLNHFRSLANIFASSPEQLQHVDGIGKKTAEKIIQIFNQNWK